MRVVLVNAMRILSNVIAAVLKNESDIEVVGCATTVEEALALAPQCDVLVVSTRLPENGALQITQAVAQSKMSARVLILGLAQSKAEVLQYVEAGAAGYVLQDDSASDLLVKIRSVYSGEAFVSPEIAAMLMSRVAELAQTSSQTESKPNQIPDLTRREREILALIGQGLSNQQIAEQLVIELGTVKNHVHTILHKLNVSDRQTAATYLDQHH